MELKPELRRRPAGLNLVARRLAELNLVASEVAEVNLVACEVAELNLVWTGGRRSLTLRTEVWRN